MRRRLPVLAILVIAALLVSLCGCAAPAVEKNEPATDKQSYQQRLESCKAQIEAITDFKPEVVVVLGSDLGDYVDGLDVKATIPYEDIEGWPRPTASGHEGNLVFAEYRGVKLAVMQGRVHYYEGYSMQEVVLPLRVLHLLGAATRPPPKSRCTGPSVPTPWG